MDPVAGHHRPGRHLQRFDHRLEQIDDRILPLDRDLPDRVGVSSSSLLCAEASGSGGGNCSWAIGVISTIRAPVSDSSMFSSFAYSCLKRSRPLRPSNDSFIPYAMKMSVGRAILHLLAQTIESLIFGPEVRPSRTSRPGIGPHGVARIAQVAEHEVLVGRPRRQPRLDVALVLLFVEEFVPDQCDASESRNCTFGCSCDSAPPARRCRSDRPATECVSQSSSVARRYYHVRPRRLRTPQAAQSRFSKPFFNTKSVTRLLVPSVSKRTTTLSPS